MTVVINAKVIAYHSGGCKREASYNVFSHKRLFADRFSLWVKKQALCDVNLASPHIKDANYTCDNYRNGSSLLIANLLFELVFQGLALWAACVVLSAVMPPYFGLRGFFRGLAAPARKTVAALTPAIIPASSTLLLTVFWLLSLRVTFYLIMAAYGLLPQARP